MLVVYLYPETVLYVLYTFLRSSMSSSHNHVQESLVNGCSLLPKESTSTIQ